MPICSNCGQDSNNFVYKLIDKKLVEFCKYCRDKMPHEDRNAGMRHNSGNNKYAPKMSLIERRHLESRTVENVNGVNIVKYPPHLQTKSHN